MIRRVFAIMLCTATFATPTFALPPNPTWAYKGAYGGGAYPAVVADPNVAGRIYALSDIGGLWRSDDRGNTWAYSTKGLTNQKTVALAVAPSNSNVLYLGTAKGLHKSVDGGANWFFLSSTANRILFTRPNNYRSIVVDRLNSNRVFAGTQNGQVFQTSDGGTTWTNLGTQYPFGAQSAISSLYLTRDGAMLFAGTASSVRRYTFATALWQTVGATPKGLDFVGVGAAEIIFTPAGTRLARTADRGATWQTTAALPISGEVYRISASMVGASIRILAAWRNGWAGGAYLSNDGGATWTNVEQNLSHDVASSPTRTWHRGFEWPLGALVDPFNANIFYFSDFWGVWRSDNSGGTWQERVKGMPNTIGSDVAVTTDGKIFTGSMDNGLLRSTDGGTTYQALCPGAVYDETVAGHVWRVVASGARVVATNSPWNRPANQILISENGGSTFSKVSAGLPLSYPTGNTVWDKGYARALAKDPSNANRYYLGIDGDTGGGFFYSTNGGYDWVRPSGQPSSLRIYNGLAVDPTQTSRLYWGAAAGNGGVFKSENYGLSWTRVFTGWVFDLAVAPDGAAYAGVDSNGPTLYRSTNGGSTWSQLKKFAGSGTCEAIAPDPTNPNRLAVSTLQWSGTVPGKIYITEDRGATWTDITLNLPDGSGAAAMTFSADGNKLYLNRDAGGVYVMNLSTADTTPPSKPANLSHTVSGDSRVNLSWSASTDNVGVTGYKIVRNGSEIASVSGTSHTDSNTQYETPYAYTVKAFDAAGNLSAASDPRNVTLYDTTPPSAPSNLSFTIVSNRVRLVWGASFDNVAVTGYRVYRSGAQIAAPTETQHEDATPLLNVLYTYTVKAVDARSNLSAASNAVNVTVTDPTAPSNLTAAPASGRINLAWDAPANFPVYGYNIYRNGTWNRSCTTTAQADTSVVSGTTYTYSVRAYTAANVLSGSSNTVSATAQ